MNAISFLTMNIQGDDKNVFPYLTDSEFDRMDCSKTAQWDFAFDHAESKGMFFYFKTLERENDHLLVGNNRTLYYRELIAVSLNMPLVSHFHTAFSSRRHGSALDTILL
jgi:hypothetical protein